jgi:vitamin B12 transporter
MSKLNRIPCAAAALAILASSQPMGAAAQQATALPELTVATPKAQGATLERPAVSKPAEPTPAPSPAPAQTRAPSRPAPSAAAPAAPAAPVEAAAGLEQTDTVGGVPTNTIGTQVTVVTAADLARQQTRHVVDALRSLPGVQVASTGSVGSLAQVRLRGAEGRHTRVMIDGIEANTTKDAEFDFSNLLADDIERIEIIRGPMSALYGAGALGGTINIITKRSAGPLTATLRTEGGSFGTKDIAGRIAAGNSQGYIALSGQWRQTGGFNVAPEGNENDGTRIGNFGLAAGYKLTPSARLDVTLRHTDKRAEYDEFGSNFFRAPFQTADDANNVLRDKNTLAGVTLAWDSFGGALTQEVKGTYAASKADNTYASFPGGLVGTSGTSSDKGERLTGSYAATLRMRAPGIGLEHSLTGLVDTRRETFTPFSALGFGIYDADGRTHTREQSGAGAEWRGTFNNRLTVTAGARHDLNDTFDDVTTWRASLSYAATELGLRPHASVGKGSKLPGLYDQFGPSTASFQPNPNLQAETSRGYDVGIEWTTWGGRALFDVTYFAHDLQDKISLGFDPVTFRSTTINASGISKRQGVEVSARLSLSAAVSLGLAYTYTNAEQPDGSPEFRRAPHTGRADLRYTSLDGKLTAGLAVAYTGTKLDKAFFVTPAFDFRSSSVALDPFWLVTLAASYRLQPNLELYGRVENALDQKYQEVYGYNTAGIAAFVGMKVTFGPGASTGPGVNSPR